LRQFAHDQIMKLVTMFSDHQSSTQRSGAGDGVAVMSELNRSPAELRVAAY
jgi:hypothetical protein